MSRRYKFVLSTVSFIMDISNRNCIEKQTTTGQTTPILNNFIWKLFQSYSILENFLLYYREEAQRIGLK